LKLAGYIIEAHRSTNATLKSQKATLIFALIAISTLMQQVRVHKTGKSKNVCINHGKKLLAAVQRTLGVTLIQLPLAQRQEQQIK